MADYSFAIKPKTTGSASDTDAVTGMDIESLGNSASIRTGVVAPLEVEWGAPSFPLEQQQQQRRQSRKNPLRFKQTFRKLGGALNNTLNVAKWINDLEQSQELADQLDRVNGENIDDQERHDICRQAMEACLGNIRQHLLEFLDDHPQATYEEWICELHPDNINDKLEGLTNTPMIDHRFYVKDSDHRLLWNEHLNKELRHFVPARSSAAAASTGMDTNNTNADNANNSSHQQQQVDLLL
jgi:hypothetical protein